MFYYNLNTGGSLLNSLQPQAKACGSYLFGRFRRNFFEAVRRRFKIVQYLKRSRTAGIFIVFFQESFQFLQLLAACEKKRLHI